MKLTLEQLSPCCHVVPLMAGDKLMVGNGKSKKDCMVINQKLLDMGVETRVAKNPFNEWTIAILKLPDLE